MKPIATFQAQPRHFWAHVKLLSEGQGYSSEGKLKRYTTSDLKQFLAAYGLSIKHLDDLATTGTTYGELITAYIDYRANVLETFVAVNLMNREQAKLEFEGIYSSYTISLFAIAMPSYYRSPRELSQTYKNFTIANNFFDVSLLWYDTEKNVKSGNQWNCS